MTSPIFDDCSRPNAGRRRAFTLLEVLTTLAFLVVVMGLMVSLARYVRAQSAQQYTRHLLAELDTAQRQYSTQIPPYAGPPLGSTLDESAAKDYVVQMNGAYIAPLLARLHPADKQTPVRDAWGNAVGYLASQNPGIGMAPQNRPFFFSAGPDGRFLTRQDNRYSYEKLGPGESLDLPLPMSVGPLDTANNQPTTAPLHPT